MWTRSGSIGQLTPIPVSVPVVTGKIAMVRSTSEDNVIVSVLSTERMMS